MTVYVVGQLTIHDQERYGRYLSRFMEVFTKYDGRVLAADDNPEAVEGTWSHQRFVLLQFPDKEAFERWAYSPEYREIAADRHAAADGPMLLVQGLPQAP